MKNKRQIVNLLLLVVLVYLSWVLGRSLWDVYGAQDRVAEAGVELSEARSENEVLKERWEEVNTGEFKEREVRDKLGRQLPGETIVIVPEIGLRRQSDVGSETDRPNWEKWWELFFLES